MYDYNQSKLRKFVNYGIGSLISVGISLVLILLFACFIKWFNFKDSVIMPANIIIKIVSVVIGTIVITRDGTNGLIKGFFVGVIYSILCWLLFSILAGSFSFGLSQIIDFACNIVCGIITGVIVVNVKK